MNYFLRGCGKWNKRNTRCDNAGSEHASCHLLSPLHFSLLIGEDRFYELHLVVVRVTSARGNRAIVAQLPRIMSARTTSDQV
jgi:hypothetical protein